MNKRTTISIKKTTKKELDKYKVHPREIYDDVLKRIMLGYIKEGG